MLWVIIPAFINICLTWCVHSYLRPAVVEESFMTTLDTFFQPNQLNVADKSVSLFRQRWFKLCNFGVCQNTSEAFTASRILPKSLIVIGFHFSSSLCLHFLSVSYKSTTDLCCRSQRHCILKITNTAIIRIWIHLTAMLI